VIIFHPSCDPSNLHEFAEGIIDRASIRKRKERRGHFPRRSILYTDQMISGDG
jgi:hypothetical protein